MHKLGMGAEAISRAKKFKNKSHRVVLQTLVHNYPDYLTFQQIADDTNFERAHVRRVVRHLLRRGLAEYSQLFGEFSGMIMGSGHAATTLGKVVHALIEKNGTVEVV